MVNFRQMRESSIRAQLGNQPRTAIPRPRVRSIAAIRSLDSSTRTHYCGGCRAEISAALWLERLANSVRKFARACLGISGKATLSRLICPLSRRFVRAAPSAWNLAKTLLISRHEEWRTRRDSNSRPLPSEGMTLDSADDGGAALHGTRPCEAPGVPAPANHAPYALFTLNPGLQGLLELVGGLLLALGWFTRTVAFVLAGNMAVAYFMPHAPGGFFPLLNGGELAIVYCFFFVYLVVGGGGWS
jgi:putative oxidoreductase